MTPAQQAIAFIKAAREQRRCLGDIAQAAGLDFADAAEVMARGIKAGRLKIVDHGPCDRWVEVVGQNA